MILNEEQSMLRDTLLDLLAEQSPPAALRDWRDRDGIASFNPELWQQLAELGLGALALPEQHGGLGFGYLGLGAAMEALGRNLSLTPLVGSSVLAGELIARAGSQQQCNDWLPAIATGTVFAVAIDEGSHHNPTQLHTQLKDDKLNGRKTMVLNADCAEQYLVIANSDQGRVVAVVAANSAGLECTTEQLMDGSCVSTLCFDNVQPQALLGESECAQAISDALDISALATAAEQLGGAEALLEQTVVFLNEREQFGVKIGSFQALQHRCAQLFCDLELAKSALAGALYQLDNGRVELAKMASQAKALANDIYLKTSNEATQLHGGMGVTDEMDIGLYLKRSRVCNQLFGDSRYHCDRFATLSGF